MLVFSPASSPAGRWKFLMMKRRQFITLLGGAAVAGPLAARAQHSGRTSWKLGILEIVPKGANAANFGALLGGLRELGYVEGHNLVIEYRSADGAPERFPSLAAELVRLNVDLIVTRGTSAVMAAKNATGSIPVVMAASGEPLRAGIVAGLARPGGNVTGLSAFGAELAAKRVELLSEAISPMTRMAFIHNMGNPAVPPAWEETKRASHLLGIEPRLFDVRTPQDVAVAFAAARDQRVDAAVVGNDTVTHANRQGVVDLAAKHRVPTMYLTRAFVEAGGLMAHGVSYPDLYRRAATFVDKIFKGAKPNELPIEQPTKFELIVNLRAARAIGLAFHPLLLARADEVIE
jgi:putative ABC transport system substrate-binding protein